MIGCAYSFTVLILSQLALVAECTHYVQNFGLQDELGSEDLIFFTQKPMHKNKSYGGPTTALPNVGITTQEPKVTELEYEEEWLLPGFAAEEDLLLNRDKRAVESSGSGAPELNACLGVDNSEDFSSNSAFTTATETAIFEICKTKATTLSSVEVLEIDVENSTINFKFVFPSSPDTSNSAQCLRDIQSQGSIAIGEKVFQITKDPLIENGANQLVAAVCELCPAEQVCILNVAKLHFCGNTGLYNSSQSDQSLTKADDIVARLSTPSEIPIGSKLYNEFYISSNGFLSVVNNAGPRSIAMENVNFDTIAVAWTDLDMRLNGDVFYRLYTNTAPVSVETKAVLDRASLDIKNFAPKAEFSATTVIVVTWKEIAKLFGNSLQHATFQLVLASNGFETYALYFYGDNNWANTNDVVIGFKNDQETTTNQFSQSSLITDLKWMSGNTAVDGIWIYKMGEVELNYFTRCKAFHSNEASQKKDYKKKNIDVPSCPCTTDFLNERFIKEISDDNRVCYVINTLNMYSTYSRLCCYSPSSAEFIESDPYSGSLLKYNPLTNRAQYIEEDFTPWSDCCIKVSKCKLFRQVRPTKKCISVSTESLIFGFGDPHISTLDQYSYTFNGLGEYIFLKIDNFIIQMRAVKATDAQGKMLPATVFGGFVVSDGNSVNVQIHLSNSIDRLVVYVDGKDVSNEFYDKTDYLNTISNSISLSRSGTHSADIVAANGVTLRVFLAVRMLSIGLSVPKSFRTDQSPKVVGLVGNYDGNKANDIIKKDGTMLPSTATDKEIYEAGKTWAVTESESLFIYQNGQTYKDYNDPTFEPKFFSDFTDQELSAGANVCGGSENIFCIYDYIVTDNTAIALNTRDFQMNSTIEVKTRENDIPTIDVDTVQIKATVNEEIILNVTASDLDPVSVIVSPKPTTGFNFDPDTGLATWTPSNNDVANIGFQAVDSKDAKSPVLIIDITLCSLCNGNGTCHENETRNSPVSNYFRLLKCVCVNGYEGEDCNEESNECQYKPCDPLQMCIDKPGQLSDGDPGYNCSECPAGYVTATPQKCQDVNECDNSSICGVGGTCSNIPGAYTCTCNDGYRLRNQKCEDIDECLDRTHNCEQICQNTEGGFNCSCESTFSKNEENCTKVADACQGLTDCSYACKEENNTIVCFCPSTEVLQQDGKTCSDFDECTLGVCQQKCSNKEPGFKCSCQDGFKLAADGLSCEACADLSWGAECKKTCNCNGRGTCDAVRGCQCNSMWSGQDCNTDVNECTVDPNICPAGFLCRNLPGSHECYCPKGYEKINNECKDIDECTKSQDKCQGSNEICVNNVGSYTCACAVGFSRNQTNECKDVDECASGVHNCEQNCENNIGSFNCKCNLGFRIKNDRKTCEKNSSRDPCANFPPSNCEYGCKEENGQPVCYCQTGYELGADGKTCIDVDECSGSHGCSDTCDNIPGSFKCTCPDYTKLKNDGQTCTACLSSEWGTKCENTCDCSAVGSEGCIKESGCKCKPGWTGVKCDQDQDECGIAGQCTITGSVCVNTPGSYQCNCKDGYQLSADKSSCENKNECSFTPKVCEQICIDNDGSFYCSCDVGFSLNSTRNECEDIDECKTGKSNCEQKCRNIVGSFVCECNDGYTINSDRKTCRAEVDCDAPGTCDQKCAKIDGNDTCGCQEKYELNSDGKKCDEVDQCNPNPCKLGNCTTSHPNFTCACSPGYQLKNDDITCEECPEGKYGNNCANMCTCTTSNTKFCDKASGVCNCNDGWTGDTCNVDKDECSMSSGNNCTSDTTCRNTNGSYICECKSGSVSVNGNCQECPEGKYGNNCASTCACITSKTASCNKINGDCTCKDGWEGDTCNVDVNECNNATICNSIPRSRCENLNGSFNCKCDAGYTKFNGKCEDQNECLSTSLNNCAGQNQVCENNVGSFKCDCKKGYFKDGDMCKDIDECLVNNNGCEINCTNTDGSSYCSCPPDQTLNVKDSQSCYATSQETKKVYQIRLDINKDDIVNDPDLYPHKKLKSDIGKAILDYIKSVDNSGVVYVNVTNLRVGSIIADMDVIALQFQSLNASVLAKQFYDLLQGKKLVIDGTSTNVLGITNDGTTLTSNSSQCDILKEIKACDSTTEICEVENDKPVCRPVSETSSQDLALIIGLSVGIPAAFLLISLLTCCIYFCVKRNRNQSRSNERAEPRDPFKSVFSGPVPKRGGWAANRYGLYSPDTLSAASQASSDSDGKLIKARQKPGRMDFNDSAWNDNRSFSYPSGPQEGASPNFSWEHMFKALEPMRNFEIQRPNVQPSPAYPSRGRRPDSMA